MTTSRLSRYLVGIVTLCYISTTAAIICFFAFTTSTTLAGAFVSVTPTACSQLRPSTTTRNSFQFISGKINN